MDSRSNLARNLKSLMGRSPDLDSGPKLAKRSEVAQATISRILNRRVGASVDVIDSLAKAFGVNPWMLLRPDIEIAQREAEFYAAMRKQFDKIEK